MRASTIKVMYVKRRQENEGVKFTFFALLTGDVSDSFFYNSKPHFAQGRELLSLCSTTSNTEDPSPDRQP